MRAYHDEEWGVPSWDETHLFELLVLEGAQAGLSWSTILNKRAGYRPNFDYSGRLEMLVWSIPAMTVLLVGGVAWVGSHDLDPRKLISSTAKPVRVQVVSLDWKWLFVYPDQGIATVNQLTIPVGTPVSFELTSSGVMNSFFVPQLGSQIYTMAGMVSHLHLRADDPGTYRGMSAQFSGVPTGMVT